MTKWLLIICFTLTGCGQTGPLYLAHPGSVTHAQAPAQTVPTTQPIAEPPPDVENLPAGANVPGDFQPPMTGP